MDTINLQRKTRALNGTVEAYWFENENVGLGERAQFHRITIPLEPFESGLEYEEQPLSTSIVLEWYKLNLIEPANPDKMNLNFEKYPDAEGSVYVGNAHNWCDVKQLKLTKSANGGFNAQCKMLIEFENEGVAENEVFEFQTELEFIKA